MVTIVYDTGALLAAERRNPDFLALHDELTAARRRRRHRDGPGVISRLLARNDGDSDLSGSPPGSGRCWS